MATYVILFYGYVQTASTNHQPSLNLGCPGSKTPKHMQIGSKTHLEVLWNAIQIRFIQMFLSPDTLVLILDYEHVSLAAHHSKMTSNPARPISQLTAWLFVGEDDGSIVYFSCFYVRTKWITPTPSPQQAMQIDEAGGSFLQCVTVKTFSDVFLVLNGDLWGKCFSGCRGIFYYCNTASCHWTTLEEWLSGLLFHNKSLQMFKHYNILIWNR